MKYILTLFLITTSFFLGCESSQTSVETSTKSSSSSPQPVVEDTSIQPPKPPSI